MYRIIQKDLKNSQTDFFTFLKPEEKTIKFVVRELTTNISEDELFEKLILKGYEITAIRRFA